MHIKQKLQEQIQLFLGIILGKDFIKEFMTGMKTEQIIGVKQRLM